jgi:hypothetical protein
MGINNIDMSDNYYAQCPAAMADGRLLCDFRESSTREQLHRAKLNIMDENEYRVYLQANGKAILDTEWEKLKKDNSCFTTPCIHNFPSRCTPMQLEKELELYTNRVESKCESLRDYRIGGK